MYYLSISEMLKRDSSEELFVRAVFCPIPGARKSMAAKVLFDEQLPCLRLTSFLLQKLFNRLLQISFLIVFF